MVKSETKTIQIVKNTNRTWKIAKINSKWNGGNVNRFGTETQQAHAVSHVKWNMF